MVADRGSEVANIQKHGLGFLGPRGTGPDGVSRRRRRPSRSGAGLPRRQARRLRGHRCAKMDLAHQLEVRCREFSGRHLPQPVAPVGRHDRDWSLGATRPAARQRICQGPACLGRLPTGPWHAQRAYAGTIRLSAWLRAISRRRRILSGTRFTKGNAALAARQDSGCRSPGTCSPIPPGTAVSLGRCASGTRTARPRPRHGASSWSMPTRLPW